ncbi:hypothetical protein DFH07DRAFT_363508 [Mycena maculata]|uniref:Uncharacterized protein n=1 Tax=Mycena maculata TaxID=230809 RepID=A0AAD7JIA0_9AGAR|nr:hypothetical protein DFH07DRAFT_363508 [Mycena maculata]
MSLVLVICLFAPLLPRPRTQVRRTTKYWQRYGLWSPNSRVSSDSSQASPRTPNGKRISTAGRCARLSGRVRRSQACRRRQRSRRREARTCTGLTRAAARLDLGAVRPAPYPPHRRALPRVARVAPAPVDAHAHGGRRAGATINCGYSSLDWSTELRDTTSPQTIRASRLRYSTGARRNERAFAGERTLRGDCRLRVGGVPEPLGILELGIGTGIVGIVLGAPAGERTLWELQGWSSGSPSCPNRFCWVKRRAARRRRSFRTRSNACIRSGRIRGCVEQMAFALTRRAMPWVRARTNAPQKISDSGIGVSAWLVSSLPSFPQSVLGRDRQ